MYRARLRARYFSTPAFAFDIDGVLLRGSTPLPRASETLRKLASKRLPFVLLTNGGGELETSKAAKLSKLLNLPIHPLQVILSHTPMRPLCASLSSRRVLVLGCRDALGVARGYGLTRAVSALDLLRDDPRRYPFIDCDRVPLPHREEPFAGVMVLHDPNSWGLEVQLACDVLRGGWPLGSGGRGGQSCPMWISNQDLTFAGAYEGAPRLAGGPSPMRCARCGKPHARARRR